MRRLSIYIIILLSTFATLYGNDQLNEKRLYELIAADARQEPNPESSFAFGNKVRFAGYIKGYHPNMLSEVSGIVYLENEFTREDMPYVIEPDSTGWFQVEMELSAPTRPFLCIGNIMSGGTRLTPYFEPGLTTALVFDLEDKNFTSGKSFFTGVTGRLNNELFELDRLKMEMINSSEAFDNVESMISFFTSLKDSLMLVLDETLKQKEYLPLTKQLIKNEILMVYGYLIFNQMDDLQMKNALVDTATGIRMLIRDTASHTGRYDFIKAIPDEPIVTASNEFSGFINRYEYSDIFRGRFVSGGKIEDSFLKSGLVEENDDTKRYVELMNERNNLQILRVPEGMDIRAFRENYDSLRNRHLAENKEKLELLTKNIDDIEKKYPDLPAKIKVFEEISNWMSKAKDLEKNGLQAGFFYQTALVRSLKSLMTTKFDKATARIYLEYIKSNLITYPLLQEEAESVYVNRFESSGYTLPEGKATDLFRKIIEPYKGKTVIVDFWAIWCGPCIQGIKDMTVDREKLKNSPDLALLYLCGDTPKDRYDQMVQELGLYNSVLLTDSEWNQLRQLFKFNGIPRYLLIGKDGEVIANDFHFTRSYNSIDLSKSIEKYIRQ